MNIVEDKVEAADAQLLSLADGDPKRMAVLLEAVQEKRRQEHYVRYWLPHEEGQKFFNQLTPEQDTWLILGGNGSGKTEQGLFIDTAWALGKDYFKNEINFDWVNKLPIPTPPNNIRIVGLNSDLLRDPLWQKATGSTEHAPFFPTDQIKHLNSQQFLAEFKNGSKLQGKSADVDPKTHGGPSCALVHLDEEVPYEIFKESQRRIRNGGKILITATPLDDVGTTRHPWIFDLIEQWKAGDPSIGVIFMAMEKNPYLDKDFVRREKVRLEGLPDAQARLFGIPTRRSGLFYKNWKAVSPLWVPSYELPKNVYRVVSVDPASTGPVGVSWLAYDSKGKQTIYRTYKRAGLTASEHIANILAENRGDLIDAWIMDPWRGKQSQEGTNEKIIDVWRRLGLPRLRLADVNMDVCLEESKEYLLAAFDETNPHPPMEVFDNCTEFRDEIEKYIIDSVTQGANRGEVRDRPRKGNDDVLNSWQFACGMRFRYRNKMKIDLVPPEYR